MAMQRLLTKQEVSEFVEQVSLRKTTWHGRDTLWVRKDKQGTNQFAVKFVDSPEEDMSTMYLKALSQEEQEAERYMDWLLTRFTSYGWRKEIEKELEALLSSGDKHEVQKVARHIVQYDEVPLKKVGEPPKPVEPPVQSMVASALQVEAPRAEAPRSPTGKLSRHLMNLVRGYKKDG